MTNIAEATLAYDHKVVGRLRIVRVDTEPAFEPRLVFYCECNLAVPPKLPATEITLAGLAGGLWTADGARFVAPFLSTEPFWPVRSSTVNGYGSFQLIVDLSWNRFALIEAGRAGKAPTFQCRLLLRLLADGKEVFPTWESTSAAIPLDDWCRIVERLGQGRFDFFAIRMTSPSLTSMASALARLHDARSHLERGAFEAAVVACRRALEATAQVVGTGAPAERLEAAVTEHLGAKKGEQLRKVFSGLLNFCALGAHETGAGDFSRIDAQFAVRETATVLALVADCLDRPQQAS